MTRPELLDEACRAMASAADRDWDEMAEGERQEMRDKMMPAHEAAMRTAGEGEAEQEDEERPGKRSPGAMAAWAERA